MHARPIALLLLAAGSPVALAETLVNTPFVGVRVIHRTETTPRPLGIKVVEIDPAAQGLSFRVTPSNGALPRETTNQTTRQFLTSVAAQLAINCHFFSPFPSIDPYSDVIGLAASDGDAYSPFEPGWPGFNISPANVATVVYQAPGDPTGYATAPPVTLWNAVSGNTQIVTDGAVTATDVTLNPRTAIGIKADGTIVMITVDGRQTGFSEGVGLIELGQIMLNDYGVVQAVNLDGGGSTTLAIADPAPRVANVPVGISSALPGSERSNGSNLAVFAAAQRQPAGRGAFLLAADSFAYPRRPAGTDTSPFPAGGGLRYLMSGAGWSGTWMDDFGLTRATGIAVYPGDAADARLTPLNYTDAGGRALVASGNQVRTSFGTSSAAMRVIDLSRAEPSWLRGGALGADGTSVWVSFLAQSAAGSGTTGTTERWAYVELGNVRLGKITASPTGNWAVEDAATGARQFSGASSGAETFFLARIDFQPGNDLVSVWLNPSLAGTASLGAPAMQIPVTDFTLSGVRITGRYSTDFDEVRLGTSFRAVAPVAGSAACAADITGDGVVTFADLNVVLSQFGFSAAPGVLAGDLTGDGAVTFADLNAMLGAFGAGC